MVLCVCWASSVTAATFYVRPGGSDSHSCSQAQTDSDGTAKATITSASLCPNPGDTILVHGGDYPGGQKLWAERRGTDLGGGAITVTNAPGEVVWLRGVALQHCEGNAVFCVSNHLSGGGLQQNRGWVLEGINLDRQGGQGGAVQNTGIVFDDSVLIRLQNLEIKNVRGMGSNGGTAQIEFVNLHVHDIGVGGGGPCPDLGSINQQSGCYGIYFGGSDSLIEGGSWHDISHYALHIYNGAYTNHRVTIRNAKVCRAGTGIGAFSSGHQIVNNTLAGIEGYAIWSSPGNEVRDNTVYGGTIHVGESDVVGSNTVMSASSAGGDVCAYDGSTPGPVKPPGIPPSAGRPTPTNFRMIHKP